MKKLLLVILLCPFSLYSQINFGVKGGSTISFNAIDQNVLPNNESGIAYFVGAMGDYNFSNNLAIEGNIQYISNKSKGGFNYRLNGDPNQYPYEQDLKSIINTINLSLYIKYAVLKNFKLKAGGYISYISTKDHDTWAGNSSFFELDKDIDLGLSVGTEVAIYKGLFAEAIYNIGFTNIVNYKQTAEFDPIVQDPMKNPEYKLRWLQIGLGYKF